MSNTIFNTARYISRRLGIYLAIFQSAIQFNSILFRVIAGVLSPPLMTAVALVTAVEFFLNAILEIPGGRIADRFGRIPAAMAGLFCFSGGLCCIYLAILLQDYSWVSKGLIVFDGILLGIGKPLLSGSVEAFYQSAMERAPIDKEHISHQSFTSSFRHGKYIPSLTVLIAFPLLYIFSIYLEAHHLLLIGALSYPLLAIYLFTDYKRLGDVQGLERTSHFASLIGLFARKPLLRLSAFLYLVFFAQAGIILGFLLVAIGRSASVLNEGNLFRWQAMASFMVGFMTLGWLLNAFVLPVLIMRFSTRFYTSILLAISVVSNCLLWVFYQNLSSATWVISLFIYGSIFSVTLFGIRSVATNITLSLVPKQDFATALSIQNMPGFFFVALHSWWVVAYTTGTPSIDALLLSTAFMAVTGLIAIVVTKSAGTNEATSQS